MVMAGQNLMILKTGTISKYGLDLEMIGTVMDRYLCENVL